MKDLRSKREKEKALVSEMIAPGARAVNSRFRLLRFALTAIWQANSRASSSVPTIILT